MTWYPELAGGADANQKGLGDLIPARFEDKSGIGLLVVGYWLLVGWLLVIGYWLLVSVDWSLVLVDWLIRLNNYPFGFFNTLLLPPFSFFAPEVFGNAGIVIFLRPSFPARYL